MELKQNIPVKFFAVTHNDIEDAFQEQQTKTNGQVPVLLIILLLNNDMYAH